MHWTDRYIGRQWLADAYDCADLVADVARDRLGIEVAIPSERDWRRMEPGRIAELGAGWAQPVDRPCEYDVALMRIRGSRTSLGSHIGIVAMPAGSRVWILHNLERVGTILTQVSGLQRIHLELAGWYRWKK